MVICDFCGNKENDIKRIHVQLTLASGTARVIAQVDLCSTCAGGMEKEIVGIIDLKKNAFNGISQINKGSVLTTGVAVNNK